MDDLRKVTSQAGIIVFARVAGSLLTLAYTVMLAQLVTPGDLGIAFAALSTAFLLSIVMSADVESGSIRFLPLYLGADRVQDATGFVTFGTRIILGSSLVSVLLAAGLYFSWQNEAAAAYTIALVTSPIMAYTRMASRHATALDRILHGLLPRLLVRPLLFVLVIGVCLQIGYRPSAAQVMGLFLAAVVLAAVLQWFLVRPALAFCNGVQPRFSERGTWLLTGVMLMPMLLLQEHMRHLQVVSGSLSLDPAGIAVFTIALSLVGPLGFITSAVDSAFSPRISRAVLQDRPWARARLLSLAGLIKLGALAIGALIAYPLIPFVIDHMGSAYEEAQSLFLILLVMPVAMALAGPGTLIFNILGRRRDLLGVTGLSAAIFFGCITLGGWIGGVTGAGIGCVVATMFYMSTLALFCYHRTGIDCTILALRTFKAQQRAAK
jgi:O-antigen/teichoic acid export membrane protein